MKEIHFLQENKKKKLNKNDKRTIKKIKMLRER